MQYTYKKQKGKYIYKNLDGFDFVVESKKKLDADTIDQLFLAVREASKGSGWVNGEVDGIYYEYKEPDAWNSKPKRVKPYKKNVWIRCINFIKKML